MMRSLSLALFFLRARPVRAGAAVVFAVAAAIVVLAGLLAGTHLSGAQAADRSLGRFEHRIDGVTVVPVGDDPTPSSRALIETLTAHGADEVDIGYLMADIEPDGSDLGVTVRADEWSANPFPAVYRLRSGSWPSEHTAAVSSDVAARHPVGSHLSFFGGALQLTVSGVVSDDYDRSGRTVLIDPGALGALSKLSDREAMRIDESLSVDVRWNGRANAHLGRLAARAASTPSSLEGSSRVDSRVDMAARVESEPIESVLSTTIAPFIAAILATAFMTRFSYRVRLTMFETGISYGRTRGSSVLALYGSVLIAAVLGVAAGWLIGGFVARPIEDALSDSVLGPFGSPEAIGLRILALSVAGVVIGQVAFRGARDRRESNARHRLPTARQVLPAVAVLVAFVGVAQVRRPTLDWQLTGLLLLGVAVTMLAPFLLDLALIRESGNLAVRLAQRRLRRDRRPTAWVVVGITALLVVAFGLTTFVTSTIASVNASTESVVPPDQVQLRTYQDAESDRAALQREVESALGLADPLTVADASAETSEGDGALVAFESLTDLERYLNQPLASAQRRLLESGGVLRTTAPDVSRIDVQPEAESVATVTLPAMLDERLDPSYRSSGGFILRSTADGRGIPLDNERLVYTGVTSAQLARAATVAGTLGVNPDWIGYYKDPFSFSEPVWSWLSAAGIALLALVIVFYYVASAVRALRPDLAGIIATGLRPRWARLVLAAQLGFVLATVIVVAVVSALAATVITVWAAPGDVHLYVPWLSIAAATVVIVAGSALAFGVSARRLRAWERFG
ncbi:hypothetical protein QT381_11870 [Galbitalea sp. SE-J8]|uniref:hypothetical protein n=1 Tax=Galbitalea sp. SE-J8 TaxID=3054952 RepID=UPI00259D2C89|nr:hypothetical protein [Galbitalea sp. SE-J8]MDM4763706.1 hypothetical protein [Galbitalea sp. SE-J8]